MKNRFIEVTDLNNQTFLINQEDILFVFPVEGGGDRVSLVFRQSATAEKYTVRGSYSAYRAILGTDIVDVPPAE